MVAVDDKFREWLPGRGTDGGGGLGPGLDDRFDLRR